jgi:putative nucleotidyltransferase with HDIG domain
MLTYEEITNSEAIKTYIIRADESLGALGFTEHSFAHVMHVAETAGYILETLGFDERTVELAKIAGYLHDIGNLVNRSEHSQSGAVMAWTLLSAMDCDPAEQATIVTAIGNHDEGTGVPVNAVAAALILADKADVRRSRVRNREISTFDIHDRVNYAVTRSEVLIDSEVADTITLSLAIDTDICAVMDYFEIFLHRMVLCRKAADFLRLRFRLEINGQTLL